MMIEQFHNENMRMLYERYLFELPHKIQTQSFMMLSKLGILSEQQAIKVSNDFFASITMLTFKYLLNKYDILLDFSPYLSERLLNVISFI